MPSNKLGKGNYLGKGDYCVYRYATRRSVLFVDVGWYYGQQP
jgi:hypothetical protein